MKNRRKEGYRYIWAVPAMKERYVMPDRVSPYTEINGTFLNKNFSDVSNRIEVNPYIRFNHILGEFIYFFYEKGHLSEEIDIIHLRDEIFHSSILYLQKLDFITGTTVIDICCEKISEEMGKGILGENVVKCWRIFEKEDRNIVALLFYNNISTDKSDFHTFFEGIRCFFPDSIIYQKRKKKKEIVIYINREENIGNRAKGMILEELFLPIGVSVEYYWKNHFGVADVKETLKIGEMAVF